MRLKSHFYSQSKNYEWLDSHKGICRQPKRKRGPAEKKRKKNKPPPRGIDLRSTRSLKRCRHEHAPASRTSVSVLASHVGYVLIRHVFTGVDRVAI